MARFYRGLEGMQSAVRGGPAARRGGSQAGFEAVVATAKIMMALDAGAPFACMPEGWKASQHGVPDTLPFQQATAPSRSPCA